MLMRELKRLAATPEVSEALAPEGYGWKRVRYLVRLDREGTLLGRPVDLAEPGAGGARGTLMRMPNAVRAYGVKPLLLYRQFKAKLPTLPDSEKPTLRLHRRDEGEGS